MRWAHTRRRRFGTGVGFVQPSDERREGALEAVEAVGLSAHHVAQLLAEALLVGEGDLEFCQAFVGH